MKVFNYTDLKLNLKKHLDFVVNNMEEVIIKRSGNDDVVMVPFEEFQDIKGTCYLLNGKNRDVLVDSIDQINNKKTSKHDLIGD